MIIETAGLKYSVWKSEISWGNSTRI